jgi:hypothetical protein
MLYLIGGAARTGKTTLSLKILERNKIACISTDVLRNTLSNVYPELLSKELYSDKDKIAEKLFPYFLRFFKNVHDKYPNYVVEGETFFPSQIAGIEKDRLAIKCVFLGFSKADLETLKKTTEYNDWISKMSAEQQAGVLQHLIDLSEQFKKECKEFGYKFIDVSDNWETSLEDAYEYLMSNK